MKPPLNFLERVNKIILADISNPNMLFLLSEQLQLSKSQVYRKVKKRTGLSPSIYIRRKRLAIAREWLCATDAPVSEIAKRVGFKQVGYFSRCFSGVYGVSPSGVRMHD